MITLKGSHPVKWEKTYYFRDVKKVRDEHYRLYPEYTIEEIIENED